MNEEPTINKIMLSLDWLYHRAIQGGSGIYSAQDLADHYLQGTTCQKDAAQDLVRWEYLKAGTSGFIAGLGGLTTLPITIPANVSSVMYLQIRMIAAIAIIGGYSVYDHHTRTLVYLCLGGNMVKEALKDAGVQVLTYQLSHIAKAATSSTKLIKFLPVLSGILGGGLDILTTRITGTLACQTFITE